jgi:DNA-binding transcriptional MerR regulator
VRALRFYEKRGLISPRRKGWVRIYGQVDSHRVSLILRAKKLGFTLAEAVRMIDFRERARLSQDLQNHGGEMLAADQRSACRSRAHTAG